MTTTASPPDVPLLRSPRQTRSSFALVPAAASATVVGYLVIQFAPFYGLRPMPGVAAWGLLPALACLTLVLTPTDALRRAVVSMPLITLVTWAVLSQLWSELPDATSSAIRSQLPALVLTLLVAATIPPARLAATLLVTISAIVAWSLVYSLAFVDGRTFMLSDSEIGQGFRGTFIHKNFLGIFAVYGLALALATAKGRARPLLVLLFVGTIVGTRSATATSGAFIVAFLGLWIAAIKRQRGSRERTLLVVTSVTSAVVAVLVSLRLLPVLLDVYDKDLTFSGRTIIWRESLKLWGQQPWTGYGLGAVFPSDPPPMTIELQRLIGFRAAHSHNGAIGLLLELGWIGLFLAIAFIVQIVLTILATRGLPRLAPYRQAAAVTLLGLVVMAVSEPLLTHEHLGYLGLIWVMTASALRDERRPAPAVSSLRFGLGGRSPLSGRR